CGVQPRRRLHFGRRCTGGAGRVHRLAQKQERTAKRLTLGQPAAKLVANASRGSLMSDTFAALLVSQDEAENQTNAFVELTDADLMEGDVTVAVEATTVNYKDGLAITGKAPVIRRWPLIPGIDFAGTVISSENPNWK